MSKDISTKPISGFMELKPKEQILFNKMLDTIRRAYINNGFVLLETPVLEREEVLLAKAGGDTEKQIYRFNKGKTDYAMRFDHTVPLARYVADKQGELTFPFKRAAIGKVYRGERPQAGRFREFFQADIDIIGNELLSLAYDAEAPAIISEIFTSLGIHDFVIRINNRKILNGFFSELGLSDLREQILQLIDKLEKIGRDEVMKQLTEIIDVDKATTILDFLSTSGDAEILSQLNSATFNDETYQKGVAELRDVYTLAKTLGVKDENIRIDLTIARGLDYYTGTVYETQILGHPDIGSVCSGGRYDDLASAYTKKTLPGVGISIGLTRLFDQFLKKSLIEVSEATPTQVLILPMGENAIVESANLASDLKVKNIPTELSYNHNQSMKKRLNYANKLGIRYAVFIGDDELNNQLFTLKDLESGEQSSLNRVELVNTVSQVI